MKRNVKLISLILALVMILGVVLCGCGAKEDPANAAYVTLTDQAELAKDKSGNYIAARALEIAAEGTTVGDVIKQLHKELFKDGEAGYATSTGQYGEQIDKLWGVENGVVEGTSDTTYSPGSTCTYAHMLTFLWRAEGRPSDTGAELWYADPLAWALREGMVSENTDPTADCPRKDIIQLVYLALK